MAGKSVERMIDIGVAALFAIGCAFPALMLLPDWGRNALPVAGVCALLGFVISLKVLGSLGRRPAPVVLFDLAPLPAFPAVDPLELCLEDRAENEFAGQAAIADAALELDDRLPDIGPESRVVQLFGTPDSATAGELAVRIERHLARREAPTAARVPDASGELFDALNALRQSLR